MVCIHCSGKTRVINSRSQKRDNQVWRRRQCQDCQAVFTTEEAADYGRAWLVADTKGGLRAFSRDKLFLSLYLAVQHRKTALEDATALTDTIIAKLSARKSIISKQDLANSAQTALNRFDKAASTYYEVRHKA